MKRHRFIGDMIMPFFQVFWWAGRSSRREFWIFQLPLLAVLAVVVPLVMASIVTLVTPVFSEAYWFFRMFARDGLFNGYTIMLLVFTSCAVTIGMIQTMAIRRD